MTKFRYDVTTLINLIKTRPCLWDKTDNNFKDKAYRQRCWEEICTFLINDFPQLDNNEQQKRLDVFIGKWQNVRDSFVKSLRRKPEGWVKKYVYSDHLQFLMKVLQKDDVDSSARDPLDIMERQVEIETHPINDDQGIFKQISSPKRTINSSQINEENQINNPSNKIEKVRQVNQPRKRTRLLGGIDREVINALRQSKTSPDEDEAFFISITPSVRGMSEDDKLDFRVGVLQLIRNIKRRSKNGPTPLFSNPSSSVTETSSITEAVIPIHETEMAITNESDFSDASMPFTTKSFHNLVNSSDFEEVEVKYEPIKFN